MEEIKIVQTPAVPQSSETETNGEKNSFPSTNEKKLNLNHVPSSNTEGEENVSANKLDEAPVNTTVEAPEFNTYVSNNELDDIERDHDESSHKREDTAEGLEVHHLDGSERKRKFENERDRDEDPKKKKDACFRCGGKQTTI
jgi:hypothetical protein